MKARILTLVFLVTIMMNVFGQSNSMNTLDYGKLAGFALNKDIQSILKELDCVNNLTDKDQMIKTNYENRFKGAYDKTDYFVKKDTTLNPLNRIYQDYWRKSMLDNSTNYEKYLENNLLFFHKSENLKNKFTDLNIKKSTLDSVYNHYIKSKGYLSTGYGKTGSLFDFLV